MKLISLDASLELLAQANAVADIARDCEDGLKQNESPLLP
jgi:hypothetical protein